MQSENKVYEIELKNLPKMTTEKLHFNEMSKDLIRPFIDLNDKLRKLTDREDDINPTKIVAVGDQSVGKSSVLEALSAIDLPRGDGIKTRLPLVLSLRELANEEHEEYAEIRCEAHGGETTRINKLDEISDHIEAITDAIAGQDKNVKDAEIELTVFRLGTHELTLIDLPGMTRVPVAGQESDIEETLKKMYTKYMEPVETVILNVANAGVDLSTSASLKMSLDLDPERQRTLLCITKLDQVPGTAIGESILKQVRDLKFPVENTVCIRNRTGDENERGVSYKEARDIEMKFFTEHFDQQLGNLKLGTGELAKRLVDFQYERVSVTLPSNLKKVEARILELQNALARFEKVPLTVRECRLAARNAIRNLTSTMVNGRRGFPTANEENGHFFNMSVRFNPRSTARKKSAAVKNKHGVWTLETCPTANDNNENPRHYLAICLEPAQRNESIRVKCEINRAKKDPQSRTFRFGPNKTREEVKVDLSLSEEEIEVSVVARSLKKDGERMLCARVESLCEGFANKCASLYSIKHFLQPIFIKEAKQVLDNFSGVEGLPGTHSPHVPVTIIHDLQEPMFIAAREFASSVRDTLRDGVLLEIDNQFKIYERMRGQLRVIFCEFEQERWENTLSFVEELISCEHVVDTRNSYFMNTFREIREILENDDFDDKLQMDKNSIQALKNRDQETIEIVIKICAYWKTMRKRFVDNVVLAVKRHLFHEGVEHQVEDTLSQFIANLDDEKVLDVMTVNKNVQKEIKNLEVRINELKTAQREIRNLLPSF